MSDIILDVKKLNTVITVDKKDLHILKDVSLRLKKGSILALVGESGCGKSMTVNSIMQMLPKNARISSEHVIYHDFKEDKDYRLDLMNNKSKELREIRGLHISMIFQDPMVSLNPVYKIGEQIIEGYLEHHPEIKKKEALPLAVEMLKKLDIPEAEKRINDYPHQFSGGMKQRIVIASAMINNPEIIIADEPTTALDVTIQAQILELMKKLQKESSKSIILITHNMGIVADMADEVAIMYMGRIVEQGKVKEIFENPLHPYTKALLESVPVLGNKKERLITIPGSTPSVSDLKGGCEFKERCPFAKEECGKKDISLYDYGNLHTVRCVLYQDYRKVNEDE